MIETEIVVGDRAEDHVLQGRARRRRSGVVVARASRRGRRCRSSRGILLEARGAELASRRDRHGALAARDRRGAGRRRRRDRPSRARLLLDIARLLPGDEVDDRAPSRRSRSCTSPPGSASYTLHTYNPEDFPRLPEVDADRDVRGRPGVAARDDRPRRPRRLARRVAAGAHRHPRQLRAREARDGGDRLLPARGEGDRARRAAARARGDRPGPRAAGAGAHRRRRRRDRDRRAREPGRVRRPTASG